MPRSRSTETAARGDRARPARRPPSGGTRTAMRTIRSQGSRRWSAGAIAGALVLLAAAAAARADDTIKHPGDHPQYAFEAKPHLVLGWGGPYGNDGHGIGAPFSIPLAA